MASVTVRASYVDNLNYARWGVRTGIANQAFAATTNLLDKVASFLHLYYRTQRHSRSVYFRTLWHPGTKNVMDPEFAEALTDRTNRGLIALLDLSCDLEEETPLAALLKRRHAATHPFLVTHQMLAEEQPGPWLDHVEWGGLRRAVDRAIACGARSHPVPRQDRRCERVQDEPDSTPRKGSNAACCLRSHGSEIQRDRVTAFRLPTVKILSSSSVCSRGICELRVSFVGGLAATRHAAVPKISATLGTRNSPEGMIEPAWLGCIGSAPQACVLACRGLDPQRDYQGLPRHQRRYRAPEGISTELVLVLVQLDRALRPSGR